MHSDDGLPFDLMYIIKFGFVSVFVLEKYLQSVAHFFFFPPFQKDYKKTGEIDPTSVITPKDPGDIPTFDEWKKKVMEVEKEKSKFRICFL